MKATALQIFNAAISLIAASGDYSSDSISRAIEAAMETAENVPSTEPDINDEDYIEEVISTAFNLIGKTASPTALLNETVKAVADVPASTAQAFVQKAVATGIVSTQKVGLSYYYCYPAGSEVDLNEQTQSRQKPKDVQAPKLQKYDYAEMEVIFRDFEWPADGATYTQIDNHLRSHGITSGRKIDKVFAAIVSEGMVKKVRHTMGRAKYFPV